MHARITTARTRPGSARAVEQISRTLLEPYRQQGAFRGMVAMYDAGENAAVTVTLWASDEEADAAAAELRPLAVSAFEGVLLDPPVIKKCELLFAEVEHAS